MGRGEGCGEGFQGFPYVDWLIGWPVQTCTTRSPDLTKVSKENVPFKVYDTSLFILKAKDPTHVCVCVHASICVYMCMWCLWCVWCGCVVGLWVGVWWECGVYCVCVCVVCGERDGCACSEGRRDGTGKPECTCEQLLQNLNRSALVVASQLAPA